MRKVISTLLMSGRKASPASWPAIATLTVLVVGGLLPHSAAAQTSPQTLATQTRVKHPIKRGAAGRLFHSCAHEPLFLRTTAACKDKGVKGSGQRV
jgi:hypothetical protein